MTKYPCDSHDNYAEGVGSRVYEEHLGRGITLLFCRRQLIPGSGWRRPTLAFLRACMRACIRYDNFIDKKRKRRKKNLSRKRYGSFNGKEVSVQMSLCNRSEWPSCAKDERPRVHLNRTRNPYAKDYRRRTRFVYNAIENCPKRFYNKIERETIRFVNSISLCDIIRDSGKRDL